MPVSDSQEVFYEYSDISYEYINNKLGLDEAEGAEFRESLRHYLEKEGLSDVFSFGDGKLSTTHYVGVIQYKKLRLDILPKLLTMTKLQKNLSDSERECANANIIKNLIFMLSHTKKLNIKITENSDLAHSKNPFLEVLIYRYAVSLFECLKRLTPKTYVRDEDNLNFMRGKLRFSENIRYNSANRARFYCEYDEFSEDNPLNQLFLFVAKSLFNITQENRSKKLLTFIMNYYSDIKLVRFNKYSASKIKLNRNQQLFQEPFIIAKMFVENMSVDLSKNCIENITLMWNMNKLFEEFVYEVMNHSDIGFKVRYQEGKPLLKNPEDNKTYGTTFVDMFLENDSKKIVLDTKYKVNSGRNSDFACGDIYQVSTYCLLHGTGNAILCYPADINYRPVGENADRQYFYKSDDLALNSEKDIKFNKILLDLRRDLSQIYERTGELKNILEIIS